MNQGDDDGRAYASPACSRHEHEGDDTTADDDVRAWRASERARLIAARKAIGRDERDALDARIAEGLDAVLGDVDGRAIAVYWPIRGEPDLRGWFEVLTARGAKLALPVVEGTGRPLSFRRFVAGERLVPGALNIPIPERDVPVVPDVIVSPLVGFDEACHRLGNGGGYYDRTLSGLERRPLTVGVGYDRCALRSIFPRPWDVPMDVIVTESGIRPPPG